MQTNGRSPVREQLHADQLDTGDLSEAERTREERVFEKVARRKRVRATLLDERRVIEPEAEEDNGPISRSPLFYLLVPPLSAIARSTFTGVPLSTLRPSGSSAFSRVSRLANRLRNRGGRVCRVAKGFLAETRSERAEELEEERGRMGKSEGESVGTDRHWYFCSPLQINATRVRLERRQDRGSGTVLIDVTRQRGGYGLLAAV